jgi:hypothetical protein
MENVTEEQVKQLQSEGKKLLVGNTYIKVVNKKAKFWYFNKSSNKPFITFDMLNA